MHVRLITATGATEVPLSAATGAIGIDDRLLWVDLDHTEEHGMALLTTFFEVRPADLQDCHARSPVSKLHPYEDHHFSAINGLVRGRDDRLYFQPLKVFLNSRVLFTVLGPTSTALIDHGARHEIEAIRRRIDGGTFLPTSSLELIAALRREMMATLEDLIAAAASQVADFERKAARFDPVKVEKLLEELFALRHDLQTIRTSAAQAQQSYTNLIETMTLQDRLLPLDTRQLNELRLGFGNIVQTTDLEREYLQEMLDLFQTRVGTELNRFVRKVTAWGSVGLACTVIASIYGMNFAYMPELEWVWGYPTAIGIMILLGATLVTFFRRKGWL